MINQVNDRMFSNPDDSQAKTLLNALLEEGVSADSYRKTMFKIGQHLGQKLAQSLDPSKKYCVASTVEDADFLAKGIIDAIESNVNKVFFACFWNDRQVIGTESVAPIYNQYLDPGYEQANEMIVVKSIMSGSCVVKTNITAIFEAVKPEAIYVVAPVMHIESDKKLELQFPQHIAQLFKYYFLAKDSQRDGDTVIPGIGGSVYEKLGYGSQRQKNSILPNLVEAKISAALH